MRRMHIRAIPGLVFAALLALSGCDRPAPAGPWLGELTTLPVPAGPAGRYPHLAGSADGPVVLSWLKPLPGGGFALQHSTWSDGGWGPAGTVAQGTDWFVNWADFPSVVPVGPTQWAAHWLQQKPGSVYSYDVLVATSEDAGRSWSPPMSPHDDGTPTEHGFVTMYAANGGVEAVWLDGRNTAGGHDHDGHAAGAMTLRSATIAAGAVRAGSGAEIDARVCDCCQTDAALTADGPVVVYRDRSERERRDIALVRRDGGRWSQPVQVHEDGWVIDACPVNGPAVDARGRSVAVAWFTAPDRPRVRVAFSDDAGRTFAPPLEIASGSVAGRVDVVLLEDGRAVVSWLQQSPEGAEIRAQPFTREGAAGAPVTVATSSVNRSSGFPQMLRAGDGLLFAWTASGADMGVRTAFARLR
jgi:hypothetical protein